MLRATASPLLLALVALASSACGDRERATQLVAGSVRFYSDGPGAGGLGAADLISGLPAPFVPEVRARTADHLAAAAGVDVDGRFLVALPEGGPYALELARPDGVAIPVTAALELEAPTTPVRFEICEAGALVDTGTITVALVCVAFMDSEACLAARQRLAECAGDPRECGPERFAVDRECRPPGECARLEPAAFVRGVVPARLGCPPGGGA